MLPHRFFLRTFALFIILVADTVWCQDWRWETRLDLSYVRDDNVFESVTEQQFDNVIRLLVETQGRGPLFRRYFVTFHYQGGLEVYTLASEENRILNDLSWTASSKLFDGFSLGTAFQIRDKRFFHTSRGYGFYRFSPFLKIQIAHGLTGTLFTHLYSLDHEEGMNFDHRRSSGSFSLEWTPSPRIRWNVQATIGRFRFKRGAFDYKIIG